MQWFPIEINTQANMFSNNFWVLSINNISKLENQNLFNIGQKMGKLWRENYVKTTQKTLNFTRKTLNLRKRR